MTDGAHLGFGAEASMKAVMGAAEPERGMTAMEMRRYIESAPDKPASYDDGARAAAKLVLGFLERHPEASEMPADSEHEWPKLPDGQTDWTAKPMLRVEGLYDYMQRAEPDWFASHREAVWGELTGFMWGWAVNAARRCIELPPVPNPALLEIGR